MSINCLHCFLPLSARESSLKVSLEEQRLALVIKIELLILFDSMTNDKKFYNFIKNPHSLHIDYVKKVSFRRQLFCFSADTYSVSFVSLTYSLADFSGLAFLYNQN